ncbi:ABC transporter ATP-binding protein [Actinoallomurus oryzae]|uniref:ABC transporter ATP-binding protein n=1 Tax=Actinoallomurus oryzae TaxID=502180 RepID=UPI0031E68745
MRAGGAGPVLEVSGLRVTFASGVRAVRDVEFGVAAGEVLAVVGESGAGKSATALALVGLLPASARVEGSVRLRGRELLGLPERDLAAVRGDEIAVVFQDHAFTPVYRIGAQIAEAVRAHRRVSRRAAATRAAELLRLAGVQEAATVARAYPHQLSGGQSRRAMIAVAMAADPSVIVADEPTAGLDPPVQAQVLDSLRAVQRRTDAALVLITHDLGLAVERADRIMVMHAGRTVEVGPAATASTDPSMPRTAALLRSAPRPGRVDVVSAPMTDAPPGRPAPGGRAATPRVLVVDGLVKEHPVRGTLRRARVVRAVDGVGFDVRAGEALGLVGESGCGKTTTLKEIAALRTGVVFGHDTASLSARRRRELHRDVQLVFQDSAAALDPRMTAGAILAEPLRAHGRTRPETSARVPELLRLVGLAPAHAGRRPGELSGGQRQRVGIARALALDPRLLLLDEPFSALDVSTRAGIIELLRDLKTRLGLAYLIAAHDLAALRRLADRVAVMRHGRIVELGDAHAVYTTPAHPYTRTLLDAVPLLRPHGERPEREVREPLPDPPGGCRFRARCPVFPALTAHDRRQCAEENPVLRHLALDHAVACHFAGRGELR